MRTDSNPRPAGVAALRPAPGLRWPAAAVPGLAGLGVALQVCYPLSSPAVRDRLVPAIVLTLSVACLAHAATTRGWRVGAALLAATAGGGLGAELVGVHTGMPFGSYYYAGSLGPQLLGVPLVVSLAWTMLAWPAALAARRLVTRRGARVLVGAWALAAADLFLDPQMVAAGYWRWADPGPHLPGLPAVPLSNLSGWLVVSLAMSAVLQRVLDRSSGSAAGRAGDTVPLVLYVWLWAGWTLALGVFLGLPAAAGWGGAAMGVVAVPVAARLRR